MASREVHDVVDGGGLYFSHAVSAGPFVFLAGVAADETGEVAADARVKPPYAISPQADVVSQTDYVFGKYKARLEALGGTANDFVQVEQHIPSKQYADGYIDTSRGSGYMDKGRPTSALLATGDLLPEGCVINPTGIAVIADGDTKKEIPESTAGYQDALTQDEYGDSYEEEGPFNEIVTAGGYVFTVGDVANDWDLGTIAPGVKVNPAIWWGNEIRNETEFLLNRLKGWLESVGTGLENLVHVSVYLTDMRDLFELDRVWKKVWPENPPARTVIGCRGLGTPRKEADGLDHLDEAVKTEFIARSMRPGFGIEREVVSSGNDPITHEAEAVKAGNLLWISGQYAGGEDGLATKAKTADQLEYIFGTLDATCKAGGTSIDRLVRLRAFLSDPEDAPLVYAALKKAVPSDPPTVLVTSVPGPFPVPGATVMMDAVAEAG
jgi:enamine deaminase RidA (YjgF/YER057c/UK114 family)